MRRLSWGHAARLAAHIAAEATVGGRPPILGTIILTDACNLSCAHCAVNNVTGIMYGYEDIVAEARAMHDEGIRILFFCGGETTLWRDGEHTLHDLVAAAWDTGFYVVNVVTNGTLTLALPDVSVVMLSLDGLRENHDRIRGDGVFDRVMANLEDAEDTNICVYAAINTVNKGDVEGLCRLVADHPNLRSISFNLHTPYPGTEALSLSRDEKQEVVATILRMKRAGYPVFNLDRSLAAYLGGGWERPCTQCIVSEGGKRWVCGRCIDEPGLCEECGYLFAIEFQLLFSADIPAVWDAMRTYTRYL
ncbi:MAG: radical SAM protein [Actinomycetota bacterium]|nr:radical SAM protein [Actinomycetota bacterium]